MPSQDQNAEAKHIGRNRMPSIAYVTGVKEAETLTRVAIACKKHWPRWKGDCSGFVKAIAEELGYHDLFGQANNIIDQMQKLPWRKLPSGREAARQASLGNLVLAGHTQARQTDMSPSWYPVGRYKASTRMRTGEALRAWVGSIRR